MPTNEFAKIFSKLRKESGITQMKLGESLGVSNRAVSKWENGLAMPSTENIQKLAKIFDVPIDRFFSAGEIVAEEAPSGMKSLTDLYRIGRGPSSSHTMGPERACRMFHEKHPDADRFKAILYGSLAKTGVGHGTDRVIVATFAPILCDVSFNSTAVDIPHPNTMDLIALKDGKELERIRVMSTGGGRIE